MKNRAQICHAMDQCTKCYEDESRNPCNVEVPDHIPHEQILKYIKWGVGQSGQPARFGTEKSQVQILPPRLFLDLARK